MALTQISTKGIKDGTITGTDLATNIDLVDSQKLRLGTGNDLQIYHDGTDNLISTSGTVLAVHRGTTNASNPVFEVRSNHGATNQIKFQVDGDGDVLIPTDTGRLQLGASQDLQIFHNGTHSFMENSTGILAIRSDSFQITDKSNNHAMITATADGAVELYYDNSKKFETVSWGASLTGTLVASSNIKTASDTGKLMVGAGDDLQIYHDGSHSYIDNNTGSLRVRDAGGAEKFRVSGTGTQFNDDITLSNDNDKINIGAGNDLVIYHDGTNSHVQNGTGTLRIRGDSIKLNNNAASENYLVATANGAVELYYDNSVKLATTGAGVDINGNLNFDDNEYALFGNSNDLQIYHDGSNSYIQDAGTGSLYIKSSAQLYLQSYGGETFLKADANGAVELYHNNSKKFETTSYGNLSAAQVRVASSNASTVGFSLGDVGTGFYNSGSNAIGYSANGTQKWNINSAGDLNLADNVKGIFGDGLDLQLYHDGTNSLIDNNTGNLYINSAGEIYLCPNNNEAGVYVRANGAVELYYDNSKKFETTSSGVDITGTLQTTGDTTLGRDYSTNPSNVLTGVTTIRGHCVNTGTTDNDFAQLYLRNSSSSGNSSASIRGFRDDSNYKTGLRFYTHNSNSSGGDGDERMRIDSSGSVRIAHDSFTADTSADDLIVGSTTSGINRGITILNHTGQDGRLCFAQSGDPDAGMIKYSHGSDVMQFFVESDEKMRIASDGNVGIGKSSSSLDVDGSIFIGSGQGMNMVKSGSGGKIITLNRRTNVGLSIEFYRGSSVGSISHNNTSTAYNTTSDYRLKENVVSLSDAITRLKTLKPYRFNFIADKDTTVDGFLAHEVTAVPEAIQGEKDAVITQEMIDNEDYEKERLGEILPQGIDQAKLVPLLVAAVQEAIGKIEVLETEVAVLKAS